MAIFHTAHLRVHAADVERFRARLQRHAHISVTREPGCSRFDVHQSRDDPTLFLLIETYSDETAFDLHRNSPHYLAFREDVKDWVTERTWWYWEPVVGGELPSP